MPGCQSGREVLSKLRRRRGNEALTEMISETPSAFIRFRRDKHVVSYGYRKEQSPLAGARTSVRFTVRIGKVSGEFQSCRAGGR